MCRPDTRRRASRSASASARAPATPYDIEAIPGHPNSVVVVGDYPNATARTSYFFYDGGVERYGLVNALPHILLIEDLDASWFELVDETKLYGAHGNSFVTVDVAADDLTATPANIFLGDGRFWLGDQRSSPRTAWSSTP